MNLGEKILTIRKAAGLSQEQMSDLLNVSRQSVSKWETNQSLPDIDKLVLISKVFGISMDELLDTAKSETPGEEERSSLLLQLAADRKRERNTLIGWISIALGGIPLAYTMLQILFFYLSTLVARLGGADILEPQQGANMLSNMLMAVYQMPRYIIMLAFIIFGIVMLRRNRTEKKKK